MSYALDVGLRYLRSKKRATVSVISVIAITGVALGVAALLAVLSITSGFQEEFRNKVLGVNAHVLVLKYGLNFDEYRDVVARAKAMPGTEGAAPFIINEMMLAKGDRLSGVLIKGVDPALMLTVLDLPGQLVKGTLDGLRVPSARPATRPEDLQGELGKGEQGDLDAYLAQLVKQGSAADGLPDAGTGTVAGAVAGAGVDAGVGEVDPVAAAVVAAIPDSDAPLPAVAVPTPEEMQAALEGMNVGTLPTDEQEAALVEQSAKRPQAGGGEEALPGMVVGITLAENLGLELGDRVKVISPLSGLDTSLWKADGGTPKARDFRVIGVFEAGFQEYDSRLVYLDLYEAQIFQDQGDTVTGVEIRLADIERASTAALQLERDLGGAPFHTMDWKELNHNLFTALEVQKVMLSLVIATIILVAAFNVIATLIMMVLEKRREVAILKAMGARDGAVLRIFMVQGAAIGIVGTTLGLLIGGLVCGYLTVWEFPLDPKVYLIDHLPVRTSPTEFVLTVLISLGICVAATLIPSWWAARLLPADGIRPQ